MALFPEELERRKWALNLARVNSQIEGQFAHPDDAAILDAYAHGEIDGDEATRRIMNHLNSAIKAGKKGDFSVDN